MRDVNREYKKEVSKIESQYMKEKQEMMRSTGIRYLNSMKCGYRKNMEIAFIKN